MSPPTHDPTQDPARGTVPGAESAGKPAWSIYLVRCADGSLYTGVATDVERRLEEHERGEGKGAKYLRGRGPLELVLEHNVGERGDALRLEARIKKLSRDRKELLVRERDALDEMLAADHRAPHARAAPPTGTAPPSKTAAPTKAAPHAGTAAPTEKHAEP